MVRVPRLLRYPGPREDEWIGSWVTRLAHANRLPAPRFLSALGIDSEARPTEKDFGVLAEATGQPLEAIARMQTPRDPLMERGRKGKAKPAPVLGVRYVQVCPFCLRDDEVPYIRREWVRRMVAACPQHGGPLRDACPHCTKSIQVMRPRGTTLWIKGGVSEGGRVGHSLRECWVCGQDLSADPPVGLQRVQPPPTSCSFTRGEASEETWARFVRALWTVVNTFGVNDVAEPGKLRVLPLKWHVETPHSARARFETQALVAWLLGDQDDGFSTRHARIKTWAGAMLGLLVHVDVNSQRRGVYLAWLMTRLEEDSPADLLNRWPTLVNYFAARFEELVTAREVRTRQGALAALRSNALLPPGEPMMLTDEQWALVCSVPGQAASDPEFEGIVISLLSRAAHGGPHSALPDLSVISVQLRAEAWQRSGWLGVVFGLLYTHLQEHLPRGKAPLWIQATRGAADDWRTQTARMFLSDGMIELARQVNPALHRQLVLALVGGASTTPPDQKAGFWVPWQSQAP